MNTGPWFQLQSLNERAAEAETVKESWKDHIGFTERFTLSLMYIRLFTLWPIFIRHITKFPPLKLLLCVFLHFLHFFFVILCIFSIDSSAAALHATHTESEIKSTQSRGLARSTCLMHFIILSGIERHILIFIHLLPGQSVRFHLQLFLVCNMSPYSHFFFYLSSAFSKIKINFCAAMWQISFAGILTIMLLQILVQRER